MLPSMTAVTAAIPQRTHSTTLVWYSLVSVMAGFLLTTSAQGDDTCVPLRNTTSEVNPPSTETRNLVGTVLAAYERSTGAAMTLTCLEELRGSGTIVSRNYPCGYPNHELCGWILFADDAQASAADANRLNTSPGHSRRRIRLRFMSFEVESTYDTLVVLLPSPPAVFGTILHSLSGSLTSNYTIEVDSDIVGLIFKSSRATTASGFMIEFTTVINKDGQNASTSDDTCVPLRNATIEVNPPSNESRDFVDTVLAAYQRSAGTSMNLTCLEELRGSGTIVSRNYPCGYPNHELCGWILFADGAPASAADANRLNTNPGRSRHRIRLRFVSFEVESTYDPLIVIFPSPPPVFGTMLHSFSGNLTPNYTIDVNSEVVCLIFTSSKATTASGFMIDFTTIKDDDELVASTSTAEQPASWSTSDITTAVSVAAVVLVVAAIAAFIAYRRRCSQSRDSAETSDAIIAAYAAKPDLAGHINHAMPNDACSNKDGLVFGGRSRPDVLLVYCEDDRTHCAVVDLLAKILTSLGGCDVRTSSAAHHLQKNLRSAALQADRMILFASRGADLVQEAFLCGKVYPGLFRTSAAYLAIPHAIELCTTFSPVRTKTLIVVYDFLGTGRPSDVSGSTFSSDVSSSLSQRSTVVRQLGADLPVFRLLEDVPRLVSALHSTTQAEAAAAATSCVGGISGDVFKLLLRDQASIIWSCLEEYEASIERQQLISCVAAVERSAMQGEKGREIFETTHGHAVDCWDESAGLTGSVAATRLSAIAESHQLSIGGFTDVVTLPSLDNVHKSSDRTSSESGVHVGYGGSSCESTGNLGSHTEKDEPERGHPDDDASSVVFS